VDLTEPVSDILKRSEKLLINLVKPATTLASTLDEKKSPKDHIDNYKNIIEGLSQSIVKVQKLELELSNRSPEKAQESPNTKI
jgi:hypothetical protein